MRYLFLIASPRSNGNSETLARIAARGLPADATHTFLNLRDFPLPAFEDLRHVPPINPAFPASGGYQTPTAHSLTLLEATLEATDLVFVAPVHWYSMPTLLKRYLDEWSYWLRIPNGTFKAQMSQKRYWAISSSSSGSEAEAEPLFGALELSAAYFGQKLSKRLLGRGSKPDDVLGDAAVLRSAQSFFVD